MQQFNNVYQGKRVLITGNTGFKGSWLSLWLSSLGAEVFGISDCVPTTPSNFEASHLRDVVTYFEQDVRDFEEVYNLIQKIKPDFVFHLAAQALVRESYLNPQATIETNVMGTTNVLESLRRNNKPCIGVIITSDKCYDNVEWTWGYRENDALGGEDPYSASKGAAELVVKTYAKSYFGHENSPVKIVSARAGNVIGGGDWAAFRIVPDALRAWSNGETLVIRNPKSTRPWQHVLEPLSGYLLLGQKLFENPRLNGEPFNFGPPANQNFNVEDLLVEMKKHWATAAWDVSGDAVKEAGLLKLSCDKALHSLGWLPNLNFEETSAMTIDWYDVFYNQKPDSMRDFTLEQISNYTNLAQKRNLAWTR